MSKSLKSLFYGIIKEKYAIELMLGAFAVVFITIFVNIIGEDTPLTMYEVFSDPNFGSLITLVYMLAPVVSVICICRDFDDKTVNYEIMGGIKRRDVFLSRYLTAMILGIGTVVLAIFGPMALGSIIWGFGNTSQAGYLLFRYLLFIIASIRELSFVCLVCFITRKTMGGCMIPGLFLTITIAASTYLPVKDKTMTAFTNAMEAVNPQIDYIYNISQSGIVEHQIFDLTVDPLFAVKTIVISLVMTTLYGLLSWLFFKTDDME